MLCLAFLLFLSSVPAHAWTQTDWSGGDSSDGDSQCLWYAADRYDTGVNVVVDNPTGAVSIDTGIVALWHFNEGSGDTAYDATSNNNDGDLTGHPPTWGTIAEDSAVWEYGLSFNGSTDYVDCGSDNSLDITGAITIEAWVKLENDFTDASAGQAIAGLYEDDDNRLILYFSHDTDHRGKIAWTYVSSGTAYRGYTAQNSWSGGVWRHIVGVIGSSGMKLYVNGVESIVIVSDTTSASLDITKSLIGSGWYDAAINSPFNGAIDEVRIYNRALSADEIAAHANAFSAEKRGLAAHWKFDDGGDVDADGISAHDSTLSDETTNSNDGTIVGCMWGDTSNDDSALFGGGLSFDGDSDYVDCGNKASLDITDAITLEAWVNGSMGAVGGQYSGTTQRAYLVSSDGGTKLVAILSDNGTYTAGHNKYYTSSLDAFDNTWHHIAVTFQGAGSELLMYVDGVLDTNPTITKNDAITSLHQSTADFLIGAYNDGSGTIVGFFNGAIDEVRIYNRALSADEIADHADSTIVITKSETLGDNSPRGVLLSSTYDADSPVVWKTIEWNDPSISTISGTSPDGPYRRGDSRLRKDESDLRALWHFDEGEDLTGGTSAHNSSVYDESTNTNTGIVYGCKWGDVSDDSAVFQSGLSFDGTDDYVTLTRTILSSGLSYEAWINTTSADATSTYAGNAALNVIGDSTDGVWNGFGVHAGKVRYNYYKGGWQNVTGTTSVNDGAWHHIAVTHNQSTGAVVIYIDGVSDGAGTITYNTTYTAFDVMGRGYTAVGVGDYFNGAIDEVAIYSYAKSAEEIWQDARGTQIRLRTQTTSSILDGTGADSPVGLWHFDNLENSSTSDDAYDSSVYGNDGDLGGPDHTAGALPTWSQYGVFGKCLSFDGDDYVNCGNDPSLDISTGDFSITGWFNTNTVAVANRFLSISDANYRGVLIGPSADGTILFACGDKDTGSWEVVLTDSIDANKWYHFALTRSGNVFTAYIDAESIGSATQAITLQDKDLLIGKWGYASAPQHFNGSIDEVGIYPRAKTADEIKIDARGWSRWSPYYKNADEDDIALYKDDFNDGVVGMGGYWQDYGTGTWLIDNIVADTGALKITDLTAGNTGIIQANNTNWYNYQVETKVKLDEGNQAGVILNHTAGTSNGYAALLDVNGGKLRLYKMNADGSGVDYTTPCPLASYTFSGGLTADTQYTLKAQYDGSKIRVYVGDTNRITYPPSTSLVYTYKGYAGLIAGTTTDNAEARFDDFKVYPIDRYCRYEATLTDNMCNDTTPYLYWVRLNYEDTTRDDSIWSRIIQDRSEYPTLTPRDTLITLAEFNYADIDSADTVWCYNLENYDNQGNNENVPDGTIKVRVATPSTASRVDLRLGIRKTSAPNYPDEWPEDKDNYSWSDWRQHDADASLAADTAVTSGDTTMWELTYSKANLSTDFATEGGYVLQSRAVSSSEGTESDPSTFKPDSGYRADTSIIYMMRDITPPGSANTEGGVDGVTSASGYTAETCANDYKNTLWTDVEVKGIRSDTKDTDRSSYRPNTEYVWFNIESSADDSGIRVQVLDRNQASGRTSDCSGLDEDDTSIRYTYSLDGGANWYDKDGAVSTGTPPVPVSTTWANADTNVWDSERYLVIKNAPIEDKTGDGGDVLGLGVYRYSIASLDPGDAVQNSTKGDLVLIQFAQKDKAGNWGYSHRRNNYYATEDEGMSLNKGYFINVDLTAPKPIFTAGPREANYSTTAYFEFEDDADDSPLLCAFVALLEQDIHDSSFDHATEFRFYGWSDDDYQPWPPTSHKGNPLTFDNLTSSYYGHWYRCFVKARDEALNPSLAGDDADSAVYIFQCLLPVPNTIIYSGPAGIVTDDDGSYPVTFKYRGEGGSRTPYEYSYKIDGNDWSGFDETSSYSDTLGYGNHTFRVKARNWHTGTTGEDRTPACVTFTIEDPDKPSTIAPPGDPVKYWREESE